MGFKDFIGNAVYKTLGFSLSKGKIALQYILHEKFRKTVIKSLIKLALCVTAVAIAVFTPFAERKNLWISSFIFIGTLMWSFVDFILLVKNNFMLPVKIFQEWSISDGIEEFIKWRWPYVSLGIDVYENVRSHKRFSNLPSTNSVIKDYVCYVSKDVFLFTGIFSAYILLVYWIIKPIILSKFAGYTSFQLYVFPIVQLIEMIRN